MMTQTMKRFFPFSFNQTSKTNSLWFFFASDSNEPYTLLLQKFTILFRKYTVKLQKIQFELPSNRINRTGRATIGQVIKFLRLATPGGLVL